MENFNIWGVHGKIRFLGGGHEKPIYREDRLKRGGLEQFANKFKGGGGLARIKGMVFLKGGRVDTPMHNMQMTVKNSFAWVQLKAFCFVLLLSKHKVKNKKSILT